MRKSKKGVYFPLSESPRFAPIFASFQAVFGRQIIAFCMLNLPYFMGLSHIFSYKVGKRKIRAPQNRAPLKVILGPPIWPCMTKYGLGHEK